MTLEKTICATQVKVLRNITFTEQESKCRTCDNYNQNCYRPFNPQSQIPIKQGVVAYQLMK